MTQYYSTLTVEKADGDKKHRVVEHLLFHSPSVCLTCSSYILYNMYTVHLLYVQSAVLLIVSTVLNSSASEAVPSSSYINTMYCQLPYCLVSSRSEAVPIVPDAEGMNAKIGHVFPGVPTTVHVTLLREVKMPTPVYVRLWANSSGSSMATTV